MAWHFVFSHCNGDHCFFQDGFNAYVCDHIGVHAVIVACPKHISWVMVMVAMASIIAMMMIVMITATVQMSTISIIVACFVLSVMIIQTVRLLVLDFFKVF
jgi:hypothetical protein